MAGASGFVTGGLCEVWNPAYHRCIKLALGEVAPVKINHY